MRVTHNFVERLIVCIILGHELKIKVPTFLYRFSQGNQNSGGLQFEVAYWPALAVGSAAQLAPPIDRTKGFRILSCLLFWHGISCYILGRIMNCK